MDMSLLYTGAAIAASGGIIYALKGIPNLIITQVKKKILFTVRVYQYDDLFDMLERWLAQNYQKQYKDVEAGIGATDPYIPKPKENTKPEVRYKQEENTFIVRYRGKRILITKSKEKMDKALSLKEVYFRKYTISGIRASREIGYLLDDVVDFFMKQSPTNEIKIRSNNGYGEWYYSTASRVKPLDKTIIEERKKNFIIRDIQQFEKSEEWYLNVSIPYKRGYCFYGPPGTGKTTLALALANFMGREVYCLNLNSIDDDSRLPYCFSTIGPNAVLLIEDIDKVFSGRENVREGSKITFSSLLNCLDGAFYRHGLVTIITTNHIEKLDDALLRTGRMDVKIEVSNPTSKEISEYLSVFYSTDLQVFGEFDLKMSDVQDICLRYKDSPERATEKINSKINLEIAK